MLGVGPVVMTDFRAGEYEIALDVGESTPKPLTLTE
jgi:hypothetical protein